MRFVEEEIMDKNEFFQSLEEIVVDSLFFGDSMQDIAEETANNTWSMSISKELATEIVVEDFMDFFRRVMTNRLEQIRCSNNPDGMLFYIWFDWQSAQIKFSLISDYDTNILFGCEIEVIHKLEPIIEEFLGFPYHDGFLLEEVRDDEQMEEDVKVEILKVYLLKIKK
ncbi:hypothetical protein [Psychrobacillus psychrodurans]|uniref:hypothetical protein n=1 Tax=Psychrobacillus psychrodurans TaxID=126157 RepID=UPI0008E42BA0|nr:hypothetical protein [Psychrobacillus psychrodurans]MCZ8540801.1 hypothetical protein [Psychrobacillus psychrodurans]SFM75991.1 hypothetical protein SAMN05421832_106152 [Psychrobacillus psychrodurans]